MNLSRKKGIFSETLLDHTVMVDKHHYTFIKTHRIYNTKSSNVKYGL